MTKSPQYNDKILFLDIETKPTLAYVWRMFKENIGIEQIVDPSRTICVGAKWKGEKKAYLFSDWQHGHKEMLEQVHNMLSEADAIVTYNGDKFDIPKLNGEFVMEGMVPPPPPTSIDIYKTVRKLGFISNKLAFIGPFLQVGKKIEHEGFGLWKAVVDGDKDAQKRMEEYCIQDVLLLEEVYDKLRPYVKNHPHLGEKDGNHACGSCGSMNLHKRGFRRTKCFKIQRLQCQNCGSWSDGQRTRLT